MSTLAMEPVARVHDRGTCQVVACGGDVDLVSSDELARVAHAAIERADELVVVDLSAVTLLDTAGLHTLLALAAHAAARGVRLVIVPAPDPAHRAVVAAGIENALPFVGLPVTHHD